MNVDHPPQQDFALYVMGMLCSDESERLEQHVRTCAACAALLAAEARFETRLQDLLPHVRCDRTTIALPRPSLPILSVVAPSGRPILAPALLLLAASLALVFGLSHTVMAPRTGGGLPEPLASTSLDPDIALYSEETGGTQQEAPAFMCAFAAAGSVCRGVEKSPDISMNPEAVRTYSSMSSPETDGDAPFTPIGAGCYELPMHPGSSKTPSQSL
jgi:hypothetical protein